MAAAPPPDVPELAGGPIGDRLKRLLPRVQAECRPQVRQLANALRQPDGRAARQWAHVDLVGAFPPDSVIAAPSRPVLRALATYGVFVPLVLTWVGLHQAIMAFERLPVAQRSGTFFEQWIQGFPAEHAGLLGPLNSLGTVAAVTFASFILLIVAGVLADRGAAEAAATRHAFRAVLVDASRWLAERFPDAPAIAADAAADLADQMRAVAGGVTAAKDEMLRSQSEVLARSAHAVSSLIDRLDAQHEGAVTSLRDTAAGYQRDLAAFMADALRNQQEIVDSVQTGLAQCTQAMVASGEIVAALTNHTRDELSRTTDYDRILTHVADSAMRLEDAVVRLESGVRAGA